MSTETDIDGVERRIVASEEWRRELEGLRAKEKELMRAHDRLAAERRRGPWMRVETGYVFEGPAGPAQLGDLFDGRRQLFDHGHVQRVVATPR